jgi:hypothetical protein
MRPPPRAANPSFIDLHFSTQRGDVEQLRQRSRALHFLAVIDH